MHHLGSTNMYCTVEPDSEAYLEEPKYLEEPDEANHSDELRSAKGLGVLQQLRQHMVQRNGRHEVHHEPPLEVVIGYHPPSLPR